MSVSMQYTATQLASLIGGKIEGDSQVSVSGFGKIEDAKAGELTFLANPKYEAHVYTTLASIVLVSEDFVPHESVRATLIRVADPYAALAQLMQLVADQMRHRPTGIDDTARIAPSAQIGDGVYVGAYAVVEEGAVIGAGTLIYPGVYVGRGVHIGEGSILYPRVVVYEGVIIGARFVAHAGAVVGSDGFGFAPQLDGYKKIPQLGNVVIQDDVEIGANACIDRAVMGSTTIGKGVKIDNLVQIAHNCSVGDHTVMASQVGVAGSSHIGQWCRLGGQVGIAGHLTIGDRVEVGGQSGILGSIKSDRRLMGSPVMEAGVAMRSYAIQQRLPDMYRRLGALEQELAQLKQELEARK